MLNKNVGEMMISRQSISSIAAPALNSAGLSAINGVSLCFSGALNVNTIGDVSRT